MNWRVIRWILLIILVLLNLGLFFYSTYTNRQMYVVPRDRIENVRRQYEARGYELPENISNKQYPRHRLLLTPNDLEKRADAMWTEDYEKSYMPGSRIMYTCGTETITIDRDQSSMAYLQNEPGEPKEVSEEEAQLMAQEKARSMMDLQDLKLIRTLTDEEGTYIFTFCEPYKNEVVFPNRTVVTVSQGTVIRASMVQYQIQGYDEGTWPIYPIDELLYSCLPSLGQRDELTELTIYYGYSIKSTEEELVSCDPSIWLVRPDGTGLLINQLTDTITDIL